MPSPKQGLFLMAAFLVPNSQAVISNSLGATISSASMDSSSYYCSTNRGETQHISVIYGNSPTGLPCSVTLQANQAVVTQLLQAKRNVAACAQKARAMALRLQDRSWHCQSSRI